MIRELREIRGEPHICRSVKEALRKVHLAEQRDEELSWWCQAFTTHKNLWATIKDKEAELGLTDNDRASNFKPLQAILFSVRMTILAITTETECEDCCKESMSQLISMVNFVRRAMNERRVAPHDP